MVGDTVEVRQPLRDITCFHGGLCHVISILCHLVWPFAAVLHSDITTPRTPFMMISKSMIIFREEVVLLLRLDLSSPLVCRFVPTHSGVPRFPDNSRRLTPSTSAYLWRSQLIKTMFLGFMIGQIVQIIFYQTRFLEKSSFEVFFLLSGHLSNPPKSPPDHPSPGPSTLHAST